MFSKKLIIWLIKLWWLISCVILFFFVSSSFAVQKQLSPPSTIKTNTYTNAPLKFLEKDIHELRSQSRVNYLTDRTYCRFIKQTFNWISCGTSDAILFGNIGTEEKSNVNFDNWGRKQETSFIRKIEQQIIRNAQLQSSIMQSNISFTGWLLKPKIDYQRHYVYYATTSSWDDERVIHIKANSFAQKGYLIFRIVSKEAIKSLSAEKVQQLINETIDFYQPKKLIKSAIKK